MASSFIKDAIRASLDRLDSRLDAVEKATAREEEAAKREGAEAAKAKKPRFTNPYFVAALRQKWLDGYDSGVAGRGDAEARTDPPVSEAQRRAMWAAKSGKSNLGIPKSVGEEFAGADPGGKLPARKDGPGEGTKAQGTDRPASSGRGEPSGRTGQQEHESGYASKPKPAQKPSFYGHDARKDGPLDKLGEFIEGLSSRTERYYR